MFLEQMWEGIETEVMKFLQSLIKMCTRIMTILYLEEKNHQVATVYRDMVSNMVAMRQG